MELWSLLHFLMPAIFASHDDFKDWFSNPLTGMMEGSVEFNKGLLERLHKVNTRTSLEKKSICAGSASFYPAKDEVRSREAASRED